MWQTVGMGGGGWGEEKIVRVRPSGSKTPTSHWTKTSACETKCSLPWEVLYGKQCQYRVAGFTEGKRVYWWLSSSGPHRQIRGPTGRVEPPKWWWIWWEAQVSGGTWTGKQKRNNEISLDRREVTWSSWEVGDPLTVPLCCALVAKGMQTLYSLGGKKATLRGFFCRWTFSGRQAGSPGAPGVNYPVQLHIMGELVVQG